MTVAGNHLTGCFPLDLCALAGIWAWSLHVELSRFLRWVLRCLCYRAAT